MNLPNALSDRDAQAIGDLVHELGPRFAIDDAPMMCAFLLDLVRDPDVPAETRALALILEGVVAQVARPKFTKTKELQKGPGGTVKVVESVGADLTL